MTTPFTSKMWGLWVQPDGPNTKLYYLGCHTLDDIESPGSGIKDIIRCFKADGSGWQVRGSTRNPPEPITTTVTTLIEDTADWLETIIEGANCPFPLYVNGKKCPPFDVFGGAERWYALENAEIGTATLMNLSHREEDNISEQSFEITAWPPMVRGHAIATDRIRFTGTENLNDIASCSTNRCAGDCGPATNTCDFLVAVADGTNADVWISEDHGATWTATATDPYLGAEDLKSVVCFPIDGETTRILVARSAVPTAPAAIYYSDNEGATWSYPDVEMDGGANGMGAVYGGALFAIDMYHIWFVATDGTNNAEIWFSDDGGDTWTLQLSSDTALFAVWFSDPNTGMVAGDVDLVYITTDGGLTWAAATATGSGDTFYTVAENAGGGIWWLGSGVGNLYYSTDHGTTWAQRAFPGDGTGAVYDIKFVTETVGFMVHSPTNATSKLYRTRNGGYTWELESATFAGELYSIAACSVNEAFAVGEVDTTALIVKAHA